MQIAFIFYHVNKLHAVEFLKEQPNVIISVTNDLCLFSYSLKDEDKNGIIPLHLSLHYLYFQGCWGV